jgi:hypothetical protein
MRRTLAFSTIVGVAATVAAITVPADAAVIAGTPE